MLIDVLDIYGNKTGRTVDIADSIFKSVPNDHVLYLSVKQFLAAQRTGTHKVKTRAEVKGASRKLHKQKGTGGSRKGNIRNPLYKGGGTIFGPKPHKYYQKLNKKTRDLAKVSAFSYKAIEDSILVLENIEFQKPQTKKIVEIAKALKIDAKKSIFVLPDYNKNVYLSTRNIPNIKTKVLKDLNTYEILHADVLIFSESAALELKELPDKEDVSLTGSGDVNPDYDFVTVTNDTKDSLPSE